MSLSPKVLAQNALDANKKLQYELTRRAEQLQAEIDELDRLIDAATVEDSDEEDEECKPDIQIPGAKKVNSLIPAYQLLNPESPFYQDAKRRTDYLNNVTPRPMKAREFEVLKNAVHGEKLRLQALQDKERSQNFCSNASVNVDNDSLDWNIIAEKVSDVSSYTRSADECRIAWVSKLIPIWGNKAAWSPEEIKKLKNIVADHGPEPSGEEKTYWESITQQLGTNRTPIECRIKGVQFIRHTWTAESDNILREAVEKHGIDNWALVSRNVSENVTPDQCKSRYTKSLDPSIKRGEWSEDEDTRLRKAVAAYGNKWTEVARCIRGRTNDQCQKRWSEELNVSAASKAEWTKEEDDALRAAHKIMGNQWKAISERLGIGKTGSQCRIRLAKLIKQDEGSIAIASKKSETKVRGITKIKSRQQETENVFGPTQNNIPLDGQVVEKRLGSPLPGNRASKKQRTKSVVKGK